MIVCVCRGVYVCRGVWGVCACGGVYARVWVLDVGVGGVRAGMRARGCTC